MTAKRHYHIRWSIAIPTFTPQQCPGLAVGAVRRQLPGLTGVIYTAVVVPVHHLSNFHLQVHHRLLQLNRRPEPLLEWPYLFAMS